MEQLDLDESNQVISLQKMQISFYIKKLLVKIDKNANPHIIQLLNSQ